MGGDRSAEALPGLLELQRAHAGPFFDGVDEQSKGVAKVADEYAVRRPHLPGRLKPQDCDVSDQAVIFSPEEDSRSPFPKKAVERETALVVPV